jgi:hypothetical protein
LALRRRSRAVTARAHKGERAVSRGRVLRASACRVAGRGEAGVEIGVRAQPEDSRSEEVGRW